MSAGGLTSTGHHDVKGPPKCLLSGAHQHLHVALLTHVAAAGGGYLWAAQLRGKLVKAVLLQVCIKNSIGRQFKWEEGARGRGYWANGRPERQNAQVARRWVATTHEPEERVAPLSSQLPRIRQLQVGVATQGVAAGPCLTSKHNASTLLKGQ